tara:strand:- start:214 stop:378 length:165 start_codon:yes stop_codon:yes gene_type:complete
MSKTKNEPKVKRESGSVISYAQNGNKGGFKPDPDKTVLGTMNSIMSKQFNDKKA